MHRKIWCLTPIISRRAESVVGLEAVVRLQAEEEMVDFYKHKHGDVVSVHCCDSCARKAGVKPKIPADSGNASWLCDVCGHRGIGSLTDCEIGDWLRLRPLQPNMEVSRNQQRPQNDE